MNTQEPVYTPPQAIALPAGVERPASEPTIAELKNDAVKNRVEESIRRIIADNGRPCASLAVASVAVVNAFTLGVVASSFPEFFGTQINNMIDLHNAAMNDLLSTYREEFGFAKSDEEMAGVVNEVHANLEAILSTVADRKVEAANDGAGEPVGEVAA